MVSEDGQVMGPDLAERCIEAADDFDSEARFYVVAGDFPKSVVLVVIILC